MTTVVVTVHDNMSLLRHRGAGNGQLRHRGNRQDCINEPRIERKAKFEFEIVYIKKVKGHTTKIGHLKNRTPWVQTERSKMNEKLMKESTWFQELPKKIRESVLRLITPTKAVPQNPMPQAAEIPKPPRTPWTKKYPQIPRPIRMSP